MSESVNKIRHFAALIRENPEESFPKFALALELLKKDDAAKARVLFESVLKQDPDYLGVYYHLGKLYESMEMTEEAESMYEQGIRVAERQQNSRTLSELREALINLNSERYDD